MQQKIPVIADNRRTKQSRVKETDLENVHQARKQKKVKHITIYAVNLCCSRDLSHSRNTYQSAINPVISTPFHNWNGIGNFPINPFTANEIRIRATLTTVSIA